MTWENVQKQYKHFCKLARGEFTERTFDTRSGTNEGQNEEGITIQGKMKPERVQLIKSNALNHQRDIERKFPQINSSLARVEGKQDDELGNPLVIKKKVKNA